MKKSQNGKDSFVENMGIWKYMAIQRSDTPFDVSLIQGTHVSLPSNKKLWQSRQNHRQDHALIL